MNKKVVQDNTVNLPRGGYLVETSEGMIQFGSPPETIKDTMTMPSGPPKIYVIPYEHFDPQLGASVAEIEFPAYFNFFILKRKIQIYVHPEQISTLKTVFKIAFLGPDTINISKEVEKHGSCDIPDILGEMQYFRSGLAVEDLIDFRPITENGIRIGAVSIYPTKDKGFEVYDGKKLLTNIPGHMKAYKKYDLGTTLNEPFIPPDFGITCLGPSHGFDPTQNTSGFILWISKSGIMVDPPVNITSWLNDSNVNPKLIDSVILTHCHADHDAGTFQKILEEGKITIYSTPTVMQSFLSKYSALTRIPASTLLKMFNFHPVKINAQYNIHGAHFNFYYSVHSIPTIGFYFLYKNKSFLYSSDHLADPKALKELHAKGIMSDERLDFFLNDFWEMDIIYHEAGIPPLHTPISFLNSLKPSIQKKITVYHIAKKDFPDKTHLRLATFGIGNTYYPEIPKHEHEEAYFLLDAFSRIDIFRDLPFDKAKFLLFNVKKEYFKRGEYIIRKGSKGDKFYVIASGNISVAGIIDVKDKVYGMYEYFGEASLVNDTPRAADIIAATNVEAYTLDKQTFLRFIKNTPVEDSLKQVALMRTGQSWKLIKANPILRDLTSSQITQLEVILEAATLKKGQLIDKTHPYFYLFKEGDIFQITDVGEKQACQYGDIIGDIVMKKEGKPSRYQYDVVRKSEVYKLKTKAFLHFIDENPGIYMKMLFEDR